MTPTSEMEPIQVMVVDDHKMFRDGIKALLSTDESVTCVAEAEDGSEVLDLLNSKMIRVILMDIQMPNQDGIATTKQVKENFPETNVLALSMSDDEQYIIDILEAGASGYILKQTGKEELISSLKTVAQGDSYFSKEVSQKLFQRLTKTHNKADKYKNIPLTEREIEVLKLIAEEMTNQQIADQLFISTRTVDTHKRNLFRKIDTNKTAGLVKYAMKHGLLD